MGATFVPIVAFYGMLVGAYAAYAPALWASGNEWIAFAAAVSGAIAGGYGFWLAFYYSPMPHHNGGFGLPPAKKQQWGLTTEPATEYEEADQRDVIKCAIGLIPINFAKPAESEGENHGN